MNIMSIYSELTVSFGTDCLYLNETVLLSTQNICSKLMGKKIMTILHSKILLNWAYDM